MEGAACVCVSVRELVELRCSHVHNQHTLVWFVLSWDDFLFAVIYYCPCSDIYRTHTCSISLALSVTLTRARARTHSRTSGLLSLWGLPIDVMVLSLECPFTLTRPLTLPITGNIMHFYIKKIIILYDL